MKNDLSFIIVNWNTRQLLIDCIHAISTTVPGLTYQIWVVDNGSVDGSIQAVRERFPRVAIIENGENRGFAAAVNQALGNDESVYSVLLNTDAVLLKDAISILHAFMEQHKDVGIAGAQLQRPDGAKQHSYDNYPTLATELLNKSLLRWLFPGRYPGKRQTCTRPTEVESVIGACLVIRNEAVRQIGKLDEDYFFFLEETDWCYRMRKAGWRVMHVPDARVVHLGGESKKKAPWQSQIEYCRSLYLYFKKNRSSASYLAFRVFYPVKITVNLAANMIANALVLFRKRKLRYRLSTYTMLLWWHLLLCPDGMGLRRGTNKTKSITKPCS